MLGNVVPINQIHYQQLIQAPRMNRRIVSAVCWTVSASSMSSHHSSVRNSTVVAWLMIRENSRRRFRYHSRIATIVSPGNSPFSGNMTLLALVFPSLSPNVLWVSVSSFVLVCKVSIPRNTPEYVRSPLPLLLVVLEITSGSLFAIVVRLRLDYLK